MAYCRCGNDEESQVYVYCGGKFFACHVANTAKARALESFTCDTRQEMVDHLLGLREAGVVVPQYALDRLANEINKGS